MVLMQVISLRGIIQSTFSRGSRVPIAVIARHIDGQKAALKKGQVAPERNTLIIEEMLISITLYNG